MKEETRKRKQSKRKALQELKREARFNIWQLRKWGYFVDIKSNTKNTGYKEMDWKDIYSFENFRIYERGKCILKSCNYFDLRNFAKLAKRYKHNYGVKKLNEHTQEMVAQIKNNH